MISFSSLPLLFHFSFSLLCSPLWLRKRDLPSQINKRVFPFSALSHGALLSSLSEIERQRRKRNAEKRSEREETRDEKEGTKEEGTKEEDEVRSNKKRESKQFIYDGL